MPSPVDALSFAALVEKNSQLTDAWLDGGGGMGGTVPISFGPALDDGEITPAVPVHRSIAFPSNFSSEASPVVLIAPNRPVSPMVLAIEAIAATGEVTQIGTITVPPTGDIVAATTGGAPVTVTAPAGIRLRAPAPSDAGLHDFVGGLPGILLIPS